MRVPVQRPGVKTEFTFGPWENGINEQADPGVLGPGDLRAAFNLLFDEVTGLATKRLGNKPVAINPIGYVPAKFGYVFKKTDGTEYFIISDGETIYYSTDLVTFTLLITGLDETAYLQFETAENKCWIFNGTDPDMWFDGTNFISMAHESGALSADSSTTTTIVDATLIQGYGNDYWKNQKVVITDGAAAGAERVVTGFVEATGTLSFAAIAGVTGTVGYMVGLIMPKGRIARYAQGTMFIGGTSENRSEIRFNRQDDPDTGIRMSLDNPRAWPAAYQLAITQDDGDQVWTFSPCYRNRVLVTKGTAIYRLEPDSTFQYLPVLITQEIGCRYPDSWAVKDELLHFMGNERSGLLDLYVTDMVSVKPRHKDGRLLPSFQEMFRSEPVYKYVARASADQFDTGDKSTLCKASAGRLECRELSTKTDWDGVIGTAKVSAAASEALDSVSIDGIPAWPQKYECNALPQNTSPVWTMYKYGAVTESAANGTLVDTIYPGAYITYYRDSVFNASKNSFVVFKVNPDGRIGSVLYRIYVQNGSKRALVELNDGRIWVNGVNAAAYGWQQINTVHILLDKSGFLSVYLEGVRIFGPTVAVTPSAGVSPEGTYSTNCIAIRGFNRANNGYDNIQTYFIYEDADFAYTCAQLPATLPTTGSVTVKLDYTRAPDAFGKFWLTLGHDFSGTCEAGGSATTIIDADIPGEDDFWNGRVITVTSGAYVGEGLVTDYVANTHTLTVSGLGGSPGTGATFKINRAGTVAIETQSSADDVTYSALAALVNGAQPASSLARYLKLKFTLTRADVANGPELAKLIGGFLWRMGAVQIGVNISAWRKFLADIAIPAGAALATKIRLATTLTTPLEADWGAWTTIANTNNIGTILSDVTFPITVGEGRWLDVKVEGGPSAFGVTSNLENFLLNWQEGSSSRLMITSFIYKKRLYITGISSAAAANDRMFVLNTKQAWSKFTGQYINRLFSFRGLIHGLSSVDENIYQMEVSGAYQDYAGPYPVVAYLEPAALDFGNQEYEVRNVKVGSVGVTSSIEVFLSYDGVTFTSMGVLAFTTTGTQNLRIPHGRTGKRHFIRLLGAGGEPMAINMLKVAGIVKAEQ